jgi:transposase
VRTYAPRGQTPVLREAVNRDHLSVISAINKEGQLYLMVQHRAYKGADVVRFLRHLLRQIKGKLLIIWDGAPIHRSREVKQVLSSCGGRIHLEQLPGYAPELNPDEGIWQYLKRVELRNVCCRDVPELKRELRKAVARLRHKVKVIRGYVRGSGYHV